MESNHHKRMEYAESFCRMSLRTAPNESAVQQLQLFLQHLRFNKSKNLQLAREVRPSIDESPVADAMPTRPGSADLATACPQEDAITPEVESSYGMMTPVIVNGGSNGHMSISLTQQLDRVWHGEFCRLFQQYQPDLWTLRPVASPPVGDHWCMFKDSAKVRFICEGCGNCWTSMKGRVVFWYALLQTVNGRFGAVMFKLYGQSCNRCAVNRHEHAMWYPEEVLKVVGNVYNRVGQMYYGFVRPPLCVSRREGKPREQHNSDLCQACADGVCQGEWQFKESKFNKGADQKFAMLPPPMPSVPTTLPHAALMHSPPPLIAIPTVRVATTIS